MRIAVTALAASMALVVTAGVALGAVLVLAGPHSDLLPAPLQWLVIATGWLSLAIVPVLAGRAVWRRLGKI